MQRTKSVLTMALFVALGLAGCFGEDEGGPSETETQTAGPPGGNTTSPTGNETGALIVTWGTIPTNASAGESFTVNWSVETASGDPATLDHTGVHFGNESIAEPANDEDGGYANSSGESDVGTAPGQYEANITVDSNGTVYLRAHATAGGDTAWSEEIAVEVEAGGEVHKVTIGPAMLAQFARYNPSAITVKVGDSIVWNNTDDATHTATGSSDEFDTGDIAGMTESAPIQFTEAGTYEYECTYHATYGMSGEIVVEE